MRKAVDSQKQQNEKGKSVLMACGTEGTHAAVPLSGIADGGPKESSERRGQKSDGT